MNAADEVLRVACPGCHAINRVPAARLGDAPNCGRCKQRLFSAHPIALDGASFERHATQSDVPLVVDFWAPWCAPCRSMAPQFEAAARELEPAFRLAKIDTESHPELGARFDIRSIPTLVVFHEGREIARRSGAMGAADIVRWARASNR